MTVNELMKQLAKCNPEAEVKFYDDTHPLIGETVKDVVEITHHIKNTPDTVVLCK